MSKDKVVQKTAVALRYPDGFPAPFIVCKGTGRLAQAMTDLAVKLDIPLATLPETAEILSVQEVGSCIPPQTYQILAALFSFLRENENGDN